MFNESNVFVGVCVWGVFFCVLFCFVFFILLFLSQTTILTVWHYSDIDLTTDIQDSTLNTRPEVTVQGAATYQANTSK